MFYGPGRAGSVRRGGGKGLGFRGMTPPWPHVGQGRGGLPRCGYYFGGSSYVPSAAQAAPGYSGAAKGGEDLDYLKYQAEVLKKQLEQIELRISGLED